MTLIIETVIETLLNIPEMGVYGMINESDKKIYVFYTSNIVTALGRNIETIRYGIKNPKLIIIETITDKENLRVRYHHWVKEYSNKGYMVISKPIYTPVYKLRIELLRDFRQVRLSKLLWYVKIRSSSRREVTVGVFSHIDDAELFVSTCYPNNLINNIVYADNDITKEYLNDE